MGNSATKEQRPSAPRVRSADPGRSSTPTTSTPQSPAVQAPPLDRQSSHPVYNVRMGRGSRPDLTSLLGIRSGPPPDLPSLETRRASKQEREARKLELERAARVKERERSMKEEHVDGGYLVTQGVYTGIEDYNKGIVRQLMIERRIAPFWKGLNDHSESWTENQLVAAARGKPIPAPDDVPEEEPTANTASRTEINMSDMSLNSLTVPITSRSQSYNSDTSSNMSPSRASFSQGPQALASSTSGNTIFRGRSKTLAALTTSSKNSSSDIMPREMQLPKDPFVSGQPVEAYLYKDASECPICFLYYPPHLNKTRCCDQAICSECFVQIKRPDPHPPEHGDPNAPRPPPTEENLDPDELISEPAACPFCVQPEFGVTYDPPPFRRGLTYLNHYSTHPLANAPSAMSSASSLASAQSGRLSPTGSGRRRTTSVSASSPTVITTDQVRPDWHQKLAAVRAHTARRSAAATALHTAAYLMGNRQESEGRPLGSFGRRGILRRTSGGDIPSGTGSSQLNMLALMSERYAAANATREGDEPTMRPGPRSSSRRNGVDDLEEMMMMEAIRLSLASEEDRRKREDKDAKKDAKKKEKENKKAEKAARKAGAYPVSADQSTVNFDHSSEGPSISQGNLSSTSGKGKAAQHAGADGTSYLNANNTPLIGGDPQEHLERARAKILPSDPAVSSTYPLSPYRPSHLRNLSNASSTTSSLEGSNAASLKADSHGQGSSVDISPDVSGNKTASAAPVQDAYISGTPPGGETGVESMFNFRSLAAMVGDGKSSEASTSDRDPSKPNDDACRTDESTPSADGELTSEEHSTLTAAEQTAVSSNMEGYADNDRLLGGTDLPSFQITASSRVNSDSETASQDKKHPAVGIETASRESPRTSS